MWTTTGGCIVQGEESQEAVIREMREELGVHISTDELKYVTRWVGADTLTDLWQINKNIAIEEICFTDGEVSQVKWATTLEIKEMIDEGIFLNYGPNYLKRILG